jgi:hypothetical protein
VSPVHTSLLVPYLCPLKDRLEPAGPSREQGEVSPSDPWGQVALIHQSAWKWDSATFAQTVFSEVGPRNGLFGGCATTP